MLPEFLRLSKSKLQNIVICPRTCFGKVMPNLIFVFSQMSKLSKEVRITWCADCVLNQYPPVALPHGCNPVRQWQSARQLTLLYSNFTSAPTTDLEMFEPVLRSRLGRRSEEDWGEGAVEEGKGYGFTGGDRQVIIER